MALSSNKNYDLQVTGSNVNTWGIVNNANFSIVDLNLGGRLNISVAGAADITVTSNQAQNLIHVLTGVLTGSINYILPALGGIYVIQNGSTGAFTLTVKCAGGSGFILPQGMSALVTINPDDLTTKMSLTTSNYFQGTAVTGGSANAQTLAVVTPGPYALIDGAMTEFTAGFSNTNSMTFAIGGTAAKTCKMGSKTGYANLATGNILANVKYVSVYDKTADVHVIVNPCYGDLAILNIGTGLANDGAGGLTIAGHGVSNAMMAQAATKTIKSNITGGTADEADNTLTAILDAILGSTRGSVIYRGAAAWALLGPGTSGQFLETLGAGADPAWATVTIPTQPVKGWAKFTGTTLTAGSGITSISNGSTGNYTVTIPAQANADYAPLITCGSTADGRCINLFVNTSLVYTAPTTTSFIFSVVDTGNTPRNFDYASIILLGT